MFGLYSTKSQDESIYICAFREQRSKYMVKCVKCCWLVADDEYHAPNNGASLMCVQRLKNFSSSSTHYIQWNRKISHIKWLHDKAKIICAANEPNVLRKVFNSLLHIAWEALRIHQGLWNDAFNLRRWYECSMNASEWTSWTAASTRGWLKCVFCHNNIVLFNTFKFPTSKWSTWKWFWFRIVEYVK